MTILKSATLLTGMTLILISLHAAAQNTDQRATADQSTTNASQNDNTKSNKDASNSQTTPDDQKNDASDLSLTQQIRKGIMADKSLSTYAHNVKVVAVGGTVTLNGVVRTAEEKSKVAAIAAQVAGKDHVVDEMKVAPSKS
jgi:hyperosmotically inducible periplasmic protein